MSVPGSRPLMQQNTDLTNPRAEITVKASLTGALPSPEGWVFVVRPEEEEVHWHKFLNSLSFRKSVAEVGSFEDLLKPRWSSSFWGWPSLPAFFIFIEPRTVVSF